MVSADKYIFDGKEYDIEIIKKNNKNTYLRVKDNKIVVTTNYLVSKKKIAELINDNKAFIENSCLRNNANRHDKNHY